MAQIALNHIENEKEWEDFLINQKEANFLHSWYWGEFHKLLGNKIYRIGFYQHEKLVGVMLTIVENAKRGRYLTVPAGPLFDWRDSNLLQAFIEEAKRLAKLEKCVFIRVRPQLELNEFSKHIFTQYGFVDAPTHLHAELTSQLDITKSEEELLIHMRKATRYEIKKAIALGIKVTSTDNPSAIKKFYDLQLITSKRQGFVPFSYHFLFEQFKILSQVNKVLLYSAEFEGKLLAQSFIVFYGQEAAYHYGASTDEGRKYPGAYLIQWEAIKEAKKRGLTRYNFWGVAPENQKDHRFYGLSIFKRGFGGVDLQYVPAQDLIMNKPRYFLNHMIETIRKKRRRL